MNRQPVLALGTDPGPRHVVGSKGHGISMMRGLDLPVPPAFCITSEGAAMLDRTWTAITDAVGRLEAETSRRFGGGRRPLLLAVRSSGTTSMPGMMTSILNVGITDTVNAELTRLYGSTVSCDLRRRLQQHLPQADHKNAYDQLRLAIESVAMSWNSARAIAYRSRHGLGDAAGTAVIVQAMVFGNIDDRSGAGVLFTRHPVTGASEPFGEWLTAAQGDDVVSGTAQCQDLGGMREQLPDVYDELVTAASRLERMAGDMQDVEFTVESGQLWLLQTRTAKRSTQAAVRIALALYDEGILGVEELAHEAPADFDAVTWPFLQPGARTAATVLARGTPACAGMASGIACTTGDEVFEAANRGRKAILVSRTTSPDDVPAMFAAAGLVTEVGGPTSHAAVVSREIGLPSVVGCGAGTAALLAGRTITVDAGTGEIYAGDLPIVTQAVRDDPDLRRLRDILATAEPDDGVLGAVSAGDSELSVLQTVRMKGRITHADVAGRDGTPSEIVVRLVDAGLLIDATTLRLSPTGRIRLGELLAEERQNLDVDVLNSHYDDFSELNSAFKALISQWQIARGEPDAVLAGLEPIHQQVLAVVSDVSRQIPRIADYAGRLDFALRKACAGDMTWLSRPLIDSYHTVWFELHQELLGVTGRTRGDDS